MKDGTTKDTGRNLRPQDSKPDVTISRDLADELLDDLIELRNLVPAMHTRYDIIIENYQNTTDELESAIKATK